MFTEKTRNSVVFLGILVLLSGPAFAQSSPQLDASGRLPSGKAYRIDENRFQITDHLAELEVTVDELRRQVRALEDEIIDKNEMLSSAGVVPKERTIAEKDLIENRRKSREEELLQAKRVAVRSSEKYANCQDFVAPLHLKILDLEERLRETQGLPSSARYGVVRHPLGRTAGSRGRTSQDTFSDGQVKTVASANTRLKQSIGMLEQAVQERDKDLQSLSANLARAKQELGKAQNDLTLREQREQELTVAVKELSAELEQIKKSSDRKGVRAVSRDTRGVRRRTEPRVSSLYGTPRASLSRQVRSIDRTDAIDAPAIKAAQKAFRTQLGSIQKLIAKRKMLLDRLKSSKKGVAVSVRLLVARSGHSLDSLRAKTKALSTDAKVALVSSGLNDIQTILKEDIKLLQRLTKRR